MYTTTELAKALNVSLPTIFRAIYSGKIKAVKMGENSMRDEQKEAEAKLKLLKKLHKKY